MSAPSFKELLAGATPGPWYAVNNGNYCEINVGPKDYDRSVAETCPSKCAWGEQQGIANADYIARLSPAVMREVWAAMEEAKKHFIPMDDDKDACAAQDKIWRAAQLLDGIEQPKKETKE